MLLVLVVIVGATGGGIVCERNRPHLARQLARTLVTVIVWVLLPFVILMVTPRIDYAADGIGSGLLFVYLTIALLGLLTWAIGTRLLRLGRTQIGALLCVVILANTGYFGVPVVRALLGSEQIASAVIYDAMVSAFVLFGPAFAIGAAFGSGVGVGFRARTIAFITRNPVLFALLVGNIAPESLSTDALYDLARLIAGSVILPLGFFLFGVDLAGERKGGSSRQRGGIPATTTAIAVAVCLRLLVAPLVLIALVGVASVSIPSSFYVQAAMPTGINALVVAHTFGLDLRVVAGAIAWSTAIATGTAVVLSFLL